MIWLTGCISLSKNDNPFRNRNALFIEAFQYYLCKEKNKLYSKNAQDEIKDVLRKFTYSVHANIPLFIMVTGEIQKVSIVAI